MIKLCNDFDELFNTNFFKEEDNLFTRFPKKNNQLCTKVYSDEKEFTIYVNTLGCKKEDTKIKYENEILTIKVTLRENDLENKICLYNDFPIGNIEKSFTLKGVDKTKITATMEDGLLKIIAPKISSKETSINIEIK